MDELPAGPLRAVVLKAPEAGKFTMAAASVGTTRASWAQKRQRAWSEKSGTACGQEKAGAIFGKNESGPVDGRARAKAREP